MWDLQALHPLLRAEQVGEMPRGVSTAVPGLGILSRELQCKFTRVVLKLLVARSHALAGMH